MRRCRGVAGWPLACGALAGALIATRIAAAQPAPALDAPAAPAPPTPALDPGAATPGPGAAVEGAADARAPEPVPAEDRLRALSERVDAQASELAAQRSELAAQRSELADLRAAREAAASEAAAADAKETVLRLYGFTEVGVQRYWVREGSLVAGMFPTNALNFVIGQLNLYLDAQPHPDWRTLVEVRFTNAPHGQVASYGAGGVATVTTEQFDPHAATLNAPMWGGYTVIERAWSEYRFRDALYVQAGQFFTPFGIWNVDHGSPTLIALLLPQHIVQKLIPIRQIGVQLHGSLFSGAWEFGYAAYVSNGRQELSNFDFDDDKGVGGRVTVGYAGDLLRATLGASVYAGDFEDRQVDVVSVVPIELHAHSTYQYDEWITGADLTLDVGRTRLRVEGLIGKVTYDPAQRQAVPFTPGGYFPDHWRASAYSVLAHQLPWAGLEPFVVGSATQGPPSIVGDMAFVIGGGLNIHISESVKIKNEVDRGILEAREDETQSAAANNITSWASRLVLAF